MGPSVSNYGGITWWSNFELIQVKPHTIGTNAQVSFFLAGEIIQVKESIPWVRCASGNVYQTSGCIIITKDAKFITLEK